MNYKIVIAIIVIVSAIGIIAYGSTNFEDDSDDISETDDGSAGRIVTRSLTENVGIGTGPP